MKREARLAFGLALFCAAALHAQDGESWRIGPFTRPATGDPVIASRAESTFVDPIKKAPVHWEILHTFNPAAIVRNGKIVVLYRAEDDSGKMKIGGHTSRVGMAESRDGIHFKRHAAPVFYPAEDDQKAREWTGGVEDPRIVESDDGTLRSDLYAVERRGLLQRGRGHFARPRPLGEARSHLSGCRQWQVSPR